MSAMSDPMGGMDEQLQRLVERAGSKLEPEEFLRKVGRLIQESGELLTPEVAALAVLDELDLAPAAPLVAPAYAKILAPEDLEPGLDGVIVEGTLLGLEPTRTFTKKDGSVGFVTNARIEGDHGVYNVTLWDEHIQGLVGIEPGTQVLLSGLYTKERQGEVEVHTGRDASVGLPNENGNREDGSN